MDEVAGEASEKARPRFSWGRRSSALSAAGAALGGLSGVVVGWEAAIALGALGALGGFAFAVRDLRDLHPRAPADACAVLIHFGGLRWEAGLAWIEAGELRFAGSARDWSIPVSALSGLRRRLLDGLVVRHEGRTLTVSSLVLRSAGRLHARLAEPRPSR